MRYTRKCEDCIWFDRCGGDEVCDSYESASLEEMEDADIESYYEDLRMRQELYMEQVKEQDC